MGFDMDWLSVALAEPIQNIPIWLLMAWVLIHIIETTIKSFTKSADANSALMSRMQGNTESDNTIQRQLIDEMAERRISDETLKKRLADMYEKQLLVIDGTTKDTNVKAGALITETKRTQMALSALYRELKRQGVLK